MPKPTKEVVETAKPETVFTRELTTAEKFYVKQHLASLTTEDIASDLGVPRVAVDAYVALLNDIKDEKAPKEPTMFDRSLAKKKHGNGGAVIMTEGASQHIDEANKNQTGKKSYDYVFNPKSGKR
jgi:hypothetical protein